MTQPNGSKPGSLNSRCNPLHGISEPIWSTDAVTPIMCCGDASKPCHAFGMHLPGPLHRIGRKFMHSGPKGWPQALSMGTSASLGDVHIRSLRTGACKGLRVHAPGMNPMIHLSLVEHPLTDPGCHLLVQTVQVFRRHANSDQVSGLIEQVLRDWTELPARPGPSHVLLERLNAIGWRWLSDGWVLDHEAFPVDLLHGSHAEVHHRLLEGWQSFVQGCVSKRKTFQGMEWVNAALTLEHTFPS